MWQFVRRLFFITSLSSHSCKFKRDRWLQSSVHNFSLTLPNPLYPLTSEDTTFLRVLTFNHSSVFWTQYSSSWIIRGGWSVWQWVFYEITFEWRWSHYPNFLWLTRDSGALRRLSITLSLTHFAWRYFGVSDWQSEERGRENEEHEKPLELRTNSEREDDSKLQLQIDSFWCCTGTSSWLCLYSCRNVSQKRN